MRAITLVLLTVAAWLLVVEVALLVWRDLKATARGKRRLEFAAAGDALLATLEEEVRKVRKLAENGEALVR